jgi:site-specific recombinase XerD
MTISKLTSDYVAWMAITGKARKSCEEYQRTYGQFVAYLKSADLTDDARHFTPDVVEGFARYLGQHGNDSNSIRTKLAVLSSFGKWALRQKDAKGKYVLAENPLDRVERPKRVKRARPFLYRDEFKAFSQYEARPNEALTRDAFIETALRVNEISSANVEDLWEDSSKQVYLRVRVKGGSYKEKPIGPELTERIKDALLARGLPSGKEPLFVNSRRERWGNSALYEMIRRLASRAGVTRVKIGPHSIRHTFNTIGRIEAKLDVNTRAALLNHSDTSTLQQYDHMLDDEAVTAQAAMRDAIKRYANG